MARRYRALVDGSNLINDCPENGEENLTTDFDPLYESEKINIK